MSQFRTTLVEITDQLTDPQAILELMGYCLMPGYKYQHLSYSWGRTER